MKKVFKIVGSSWGQRIAILAVIFIVMAIAQPVFFRPGNARNILFAISVTGIMSCGMLFTVLVGGLDLSVGSMAALAASIAFTIANNNGFADGYFIIGALVALLVCVVLGWVNGFFVTSFGIPAFVVTLAMKYILYGSVFVLMGGSYIYSPTSGLIYNVGSANFLSLPIPVYFLIVIVAICAFVLVKTTFGRKLYAIGGNSKVADLAGINSIANTRAAYMISSVLAGLAGIVLATMNGQSEPRTGLGYEANVLLAMIVGGINLAGGEGGVPGAVFGALFVGIINNILLLLSVSSEYTSLVQGIIIVAAMLLNVYARRGAAGEFSKSKASKAKSAGSTD